MERCIRAKFRLTDIYDKNNGYLMVAIVYISVSDGYLRYKS